MKDAMTVVFLVLFIPFLVCPEASGMTFTVNSTLDAVDAAPGNGVCATAGGACTLRAAIQEANAFGGNDVITLPVGIYALTIPCRDPKDGDTVETLTSH